MPDSHQRSLRALEKRGRLRLLSPRTGVDFSSNDYLGLAQSAELANAVCEAVGRGVPAGAGGSRLLRGNHPEHEALEREAADYFGAPSSLYFGGGFMANYAIFSTLPQRDDLVVHDAWIHASVHDGVRAGRARSVAVKHNDAQAMDDAIATWRRDGGTGRAWIAVESLYSMDGDRAPLADLAAVASRHDAMIVIDEAHATGVHGEGGRGLGHALEGQENVISLHTCGKALGAMGALVLLSDTLRDFLVNRCRPFIYATAPSPLMAAVVRRSLTICREQPERRVALLARVSAFERLLQERMDVTLSGSQIQPLVVGRDAVAVAFATAIQEEGFDVRAVRPPTVPEGTSRLRITLSAAHDEKDIRTLVDTLAELVEKLKL